MDSVHVIHQVSLGDPGLAAAQSNSEMPQSHEKETKDKTLREVSRSVTRMGSDPTLSLSCISGPFLFKATTLVPNTEEEDGTDLRYGTVRT